MASGVGVANECVTTFQDLKLKHTLRYIVYKIENDKQIVVEKSKSPEGTYEEFMADLPGEDCRYGIFDMEFQSDDGRLQNKIVFVSWSPDSAKIKSKMLYASSKDAFRRKLVGISTEVQGTDRSEVDKERVIEKCKHI